MALKIRMSRAGTKHRPFFKIVIADSRKARDGAFVERVGSYNPLLPKEHKDRVILNVERIKHWLSHGATPSDRIAAKASAPITPRDVSSNGRAARLCESGR